MNNWERAFAVHEPRETSVEKLGLFFAMQIAVGEHDTNIYVESTLIHVDSDTFSLC